MKSLVAAVGIVTFLGSFFFLVMVLIGVEKEFSVALASVFFGALPLLHQTLEKRTTPAAASVLPRGVVALQGFTLPWYLVLVYGTVLTIAASQYLGFVAGIIAGIYNMTAPYYANQQGPGLSVLAVNILVLPAPLFLIGRWLGVRAGQFGFLITVAAVILSMIFDTFVTLIVMGREFITTLSETSLVAGLAIYCLLRVGVTFWMCMFVLLGYWRGQKVRLQRYLGHLVSALPPATRETLVTLAYEEAQRIAAQSQSQTAPAPATQAAPSHP